MFKTALLLAHMAAANYKSGEIKTWETFQYGRFITSMATPMKKGTVSSFFTYWGGPDWYVGGWNEIDAVEIVPSVENNPYSTNLIYGDGYNKLEDQEYISSFGKGDTGFRESRLDWTPEKIEFLVGGKLVRSEDSSNPGVSTMEKG